MLRIILGDYFIVNSQGRRNSLETCLDNLRLVGFPKCMETNIVNELGCHLEAWISRTNVTFEDWRKMHSMKKLGIDCNMFLYQSILIFLKIICFCFIYLKSRGRECFHPLLHSPGDQQRLCQSTIRSRELHAGLPCGWWEPKCSGHRLLPPQQEADPRHRGRGRGHPKRWATVTHVSLPPYFMF